MQVPRLGSVSSAAARMTESGIYGSVGSVPTLAMGIWRLDQVVYNINTEGSEKKEVYSLFPDDYDKESDQGSRGVVVRNGYQDSR